jgi:sortase A
MSRRGKRGISSFLFGIVLLLGALGLQQYDHWQDAKAGEAANTLLAQAELQISNNQQQAEHSSQDSESETDSEQSNEGQLRFADQSLILNDSASTSDLLGILNIPSLNLRLPVQRNYSLSNLKLSPCLFTNDGTLNRLVICGHNYKTHLGKLGTLSSGDAVVLTELDGTTLHFSVSEVLRIHADNWDALKTGNWDLSLFTCTPGGKMRVLVRCTLTP